MAVRSPSKNGTSEQQSRRDYFCARERWRDSPLLYVRERFGAEPTWQQAQILDAILPPGAKVSVRSGHLVGKSSAAAWLIYWQLETHDFCKVPCTAPSGHQLRDVLWGELNKWRRAADAQSAMRGDHPRVWLSKLFKLTSESLYDPGAPDWGAIARTARKENPEALQGFHAQDLLFILDEASGIEEAIFEAAEGALASRNARVLMLGNPLRTSGTFYNSHHGNRADYTALHFRSQDSTLPSADPDYRPRLVRKWGEGSNMVRVRADGEFPRQEDDVLISLELTEPCLTRERIPGEGLRRLGVDVARMGNDRTVLLLRQGRVVEHIKVYAKQDTMQTVGCVVQVLDLWQVDEIAIDVIGLGAGVYDRLVELKRQGHITAAVVAVNVAHEAPAQPRVGEPRAHKLRDYLWLEMARWLREDMPVFAAEDREACSDLAGELASVHYSLDSNGRIVVEDKEHMKKRLGHSPDCFIAGTMIRTSQGSVPIEQLQPGTLIETPMGLRTLLHVWKSQTRQLTHVHFSQGSFLIGKGKHTIFTWDSGWISLDALSLVNSIESDNVWRRLRWMSLRKLYMPVKPFGFKHQVDIISQDGKMRPKDFFIDASILNIMVRSLRAMLYIMLMGIGKITHGRIWWQCLVQHTLDIILQSDRAHRKGKKTKRAAWLLLKKQRKYGMLPQKDVLGIACTARQHGKIGCQRKLSVLSVAHHLRHFFRAVRDFAHQRVRLARAIVGIKLQRGFAQNVARHLRITSIVNKRVVAGSVVTVAVPESILVYNLTLDGDNVYYANGILVANCGDSLGCTFAPIETGKRVRAWGRAG